MAKITTAAKWEVTRRDDTGALVDIKYVCPYCQVAVDNLIFVCANDLKYLDDSWETDQTCGTCQEAVTIACL